MKSLDPTLQLEDLRAGYGEAVVLQDVAFTLAAGESLAVLGRNGVGKTTLLATIMGHTTQHRGRIRWKGIDLAGVPVYRRVAAGIAWVVQERGIFPSLSVEENLDVAARPGPWSRKRAYELFPRLYERRRNMGNQLSGGEQQMLAIARALTGNPSLLLLDEPLEGLAPIIVRELTGVLRRLIAEAGLTLILVEQHARVALQLTQHAIVLDRGRIAHAGPSQALAGDQALLQQLLGVKEKPARQRPANGTNEGR